MRILSAVLFLAIAGTGVFFAGRMVRFAVSPASPRSERSVIVEITQGIGPTEISNRLAGAGVIRDAREFVWLGRVKREWPRVKAGEYQLSPAMSPVQIFGVITSGISVQHPLTVREGENMYEIASDFEARGLGSRARFLELCRDRAYMRKLGFVAPLPPSLEGYLFPDTYFFNRTTTPEEAIRRMVSRFREVWNESLSARATELGLTRHQAITLASVIEKETGAPQERKLISSVFHNRLARKMRLQSDPTTIYGMWERYQGNISKQDLLTPTPFNTYTVPALPIGPIGNPGREAIEAALNPIPSEYFFFVSQNDGTHVFSKTYEEHQLAVKRFQLDRTAREGKSWRDLNKKQ